MLRWLVSISNALYAIVVPGVRIALWILLLLLVIRIYTGGQEIRITVNGHVYAVGIR